MSYVHIYCLKVEASFLSPSFSVQVLFYSYITGCNICGGPMTSSNRVQATPPTKGTILMTSILCIKIEPRLVLQHYSKPCIIPLELSQ